MALTFRHTVEFSKNKHTPAQTANATVGSGMHHFDVPRSRSGRPQEVFLRSRRLSKPTSLLTGAPRGPGLTSQHHLAERYVRSAAGRDERYGQHTAEVKSGVRCQPGRPAGAGTARLPVTEPGGRPHMCGDVTALGEVGAVGKPPSPNSVNCAPPPSARAHSPFPVGANGSP